MGVVALVISQAVIATAWRDAWAGTIPNVIFSARLCTAAYEDVEADRRQPCRMAVVMLSSLAAGVGPQPTQGPRPAPAQPAGVAAWAVWATGVPEEPDASAGIRSGQDARWIFASAPGMLRVVGLIPGTTAAACHGDLDADGDFSRFDALDYTSTARPCCVCLWMGAAFGDDGIDRNPSRIARTCQMPCTWDRSKVTHRHPEKLKGMIHEGNVRRVVVNHKGRTVAEFPLTAGVVGVLVAPVLAAVGAIVALLKDCTIEIERVQDDVKEEAPSAAAR